MLFKGLCGCLVGMTGFEPATSRTPCVCATRLRHIPNKNLDTVVGVAGFEPATSCSQSRRDDRATLHPEKVCANITFNKITTNLQPAFLGFYFDFIVIPSESKFKRSLSVPSLVLLLMFISRLLAMKFKHYSFSFPILQSFPAVLLLE